MIATLLFSLALVATPPAGKAAHPAVMTGHFSALDVTSSPLDPIPGTSAALARLAAGVVPAGLDALEASLVRGTGSRLGRASALGAIATLGFGLHRAGLTLVATSDDPMIQLMVHAAAHDTAGVRRLLMRADAARNLALKRNLPPPLLLAEAELAIGDSAAALARLEAFERDWTTMDPDVEWGMVPNGWLLGRTWLLLGDVAHALGPTDIAARAYRRVVDLWDDGEAEVQGAVQRARGVLTGATVSPARGSRVMLSSLDDRSPVRFDASVWMRLPVAALRDTSRAALRLTVTTQQRGNAARTIDSVALDAPVLDVLGDEGMAMRRRMISAARSLTTSSDLPGLEVAAGLAALATTIALPKTAVRIGDCWQDTVTLGSGEEAVRLAIQYRLARVDTVGGSPMASITMSGSGDRTMLSGELSYRLDVGILQQFSVALSTTARVPMLGMTPVRVLFTAVSLPAMGDLASRD